MHTTEPQRRRNSGAMVAVVAVRVVVRALGALMLIVVAQLVFGTAASVLALVIVVVSVVIRLALVVVEWRSTTYVLHDDALEYRVGRVTTSAQRVEYASMRGVTRDAPWLLRLLRRTELVIEHGAGDAEQLRFTALTQDSADAIVARALAANPSIETTRDRDGERMPVLLYAIARARLLLMLSLLVAVAGIVARLTGTDVVAVVADGAGLLAPLPIGAIVAIGVATVVVALVVGSVSRWVAVAGFRRRLSARSLETFQGLLSTSERAIRRSDVTVVELRRPLLYRLLGRTMLLLSGGSGRGDPPLDLAPSVRTADEEAAAEWAMSAPGEPIAAASSSRWLLWGIVVVAVAYGAVAVTRMPIGALWTIVSCIVVGVVVLALLARSRMRIVVDENGVVEVTRRWVTTRRWRTTIDAVLEVEMRHGPLARHLPCTAVRIVVADRGARSMTLRGLPLDQARSVHGALVASPRLGSYRYRRGAQHLEHD